MSPSYKAIAFLKDDSDFTLAELQTRLAKPFAGCNITSKGSQITVAIDGWKIAMNFDVAPHVLEESKGMAAHFSKCPLAGTIAHCRRRVDVWSMDRDPEMDHINDYIFVCETLASFTGVIMFDPVAGELISPEM